MTTRTLTRLGFGEPARVALLEEDCDDFEEVIRDLRSEMKQLRNVLVGILISVSTASILLAVNIVVDAL